ncbi:hypothetical protein Droror1_Dr00023453 [Drosera rotundifolia]
MVHLRAFAYTYRIFDAIAGIVSYFFVVFSVLLVLIRFVSFSYLMLEDEADLMAAETDCATCALLWKDLEGEKKKVAKLQIRWKARSTPVETSISSTTSHDSSGLSSNSTNYARL